MTVPSQASPFVVVIGGPNGAGKSTTAPSLLRNGMGVEAVNRVARRVKSGGHHIPNDVVHRRYHRGITNFVHLYATLADSWQMVDNSEYGSPTFIAYRWNESPPTILNDTKWQTFLRQAESNH